MSRLLLRSILFLMILISPGAQADNSLTYVKAGRLVDVINGEVHADQVIVIAGDKIADLRDAADVQIPADANVIDLGDRTVLPGLIDMHVHLTSDNRFHGYQGLGISVPRSALYGVLNARKTINAGLATVRNVGAMGYADVALRDAINDG